MAVKVKSQALCDIKRLVSKIDILTEGNGIAILCGRMSRLKGSILTHFIADIEGITFCISSKSLSRDHTDDHPHREKQTKKSFFHNIFLLM